MLTRFRKGFVGVLAFATAAVVADAAYLAYLFDGAGVGRIAFASSVTLWAVLAVMVPAAAVVGVLCVLAGEGDTAPWWRRLGAWLTVGDEATHAWRIAGVVTVLLLGAAGTLFGMALAVLLSRNIVQENFVAISVTLVHLGIVAAVALVFGFARRVTRTFVRALARVPRAGILLRKTLHFVLAAGGLVVVCAALVVVVFWKNTFSYVAWDVPLRVVFALALGFGLLAAFDRWMTSERAKWAVAAVPFVFLGSFAPFALGLAPREWTTRSMAFHEALTGVAAHAALAAVADGDGDGALSVLGDGDCKPSDPTTYYGAPDKPNDGKDQDCDGHDLKPADFGAQGKVDYPVSSNVPSRPDIVLVTVDALSSRRLGVMGYGRHLTPNIDKFAEESTFFEAAFTQGPSTRLSFPSIFTSRYDTVIKRAPVFRAIPHPIADSEVQIQDVLGDAGYDTIAVLPDAYFMPSHWSTLTRGFKQVDSTAARAGYSIKGGHTAKYVTEEALKILKAPHDRPIFMWIHYYDAHSPYVQPNDVPAFGDKPIDVHEAEVLHTDKAMKPLLDVLGPRANTLTILSADHGTVFHPNPKLRKGRYGYDVYSATLHVPLMFHGPFVPVRRWPKVVNSMDILPTILNVLRMRSKKKIFGTSLVPEIFDGQQKRTDLSFHEFFLEELAVRDHKDALLKVGVRDDQYNLVMNRSNGAYELYNWRNDYFEVDNLVDDRAHQAEFEKLRSLLGAFVYEMHERIRAKRDKQPEPAGPELLPPPAVPAPKAAPTAAAVKPALPQRVMPIVRPLPVAPRPSDRR